MKFRVGVDVGGTFTDDAANSAALHTQDPMIQASLTASLAPGVYYLIVGSRGSTCAPFTLTATGIP